MDKFLDYSILRIGSYSLTVSSVAMVLLIFLGTRLLLWVIHKSLLSKRNAERFDRNRVFSIYLIIKYFVWTAALVLVLETVGVKISFLLASSAALLVGLGLGLQQIFADVVSGIFLLFEGTVKINDVMEVDGIVGRVVEIGLRNSKIISRDGIIIIIPNHKFIHENVINWSHNDEPVRFTITVHVTYDCDEQLVKKILLDVVYEHPRAINGGDGVEPSVRIIDFGDHGIRFDLMFWSRNVFRIENIKSEMRFLILKKFRENNLNFPFPRRDVKIVS